MEPIILASSSPRRQEILKKLRIPFRVVLPAAEEKISKSLKNEEIPEYLAKQKVNSVIKALPPGQEIPWILGADTIITMGSAHYGKPQNQEEAYDFIKQFQGRSHNVITAIVLYNGRKKSMTSRICKTKVTFAPMTDQEIQWYVDTGEWHGAAGAYRIQGDASTFITKIEGSYSGVVGLPIYELYDILKEQGYSVLE